MKPWKTLLIALAVGLQGTAFAAGIPVKLYRNPNCGCCETYAQYLNANGFSVQSIDTTDMAAIKQKYAVPAKLEGCHTALIGRYVFEGLIPADSIKRLLSSNSPLRGLSVPGMPMGAPGMPGERHTPLHVYYLEANPSPRVFASF